MQASAGGRARPRQIGLEELVGDNKPATVVAVEQMMPAGEPEILHAITPRPASPGHLYHSVTIVMETTHDDKTSQAQADDPLRPHRDGGYFDHRRGVRLVPRRVGAALSEQAHSYHRAVCRRRHHRCDRPRAGPRLAEAFGQQVVVENKPGGGTGQVGTEYVAKSAPDGYTLLVTADATFVTAPHVYGKLPYDALNDFVPITASRHQPAGAGRASVAAGAHARRAGRAREEQAGRDQLRDLRHRHRAATSTSCCWRA